MNVNSLRSKFASTDADHAEFLLFTNLDDIRAIVALRTGKDTFEYTVPHDMVRIAINTLTSTTVTPEEEALGYFTRKKLKGLSTWDQ